MPSPLRAIALGAALIVAAGCVSARPDPVEEAYATSIELDSIEGYARFLDRYPSSDHATEMRSRLWEKSLAAASTRRERYQLALDLREAPEAHQFLPQLTDDLLEHREFRCLSRLSREFPEWTGGPQVEDALAPPWAEGEVAEDIELVVRGGGSLELAWAAERLDRSQDVRVLPYLLDLLRHASSHADLQSVEVTVFPSGARAERPRGELSLQGVVNVAINQLVGGLEPRREMERVLLEYRDDESEAVRDRVRRHFEEQARLLFIRLDEDGRDRISHLTHSDFRLNPWAVDGLIERTGTAPQPYARQYAVLTLGVNGVASARAALIDALADPEPVVRRAAVASLAAIGANPDDIRPMLHDEATGVVAKTADALGILGDADAIPRLVELMRDPDPGVRSFAAASLARLGWDAPTPDARAAYLFAAEDWDAFRALPRDLQEAQLLPDLDDYVAAQVADLLAPVPDADGRTTAEILEFLAGLGDRPEDAMHVAFSRKLNPLPAGHPAKSWRSVLVAHSRAYMARRWPLEVLAEALPRIRESSSDRRFGANLGNLIVDRPLALRDGPDGIVLEPGCELFAAHNLEGRLAYAHPGGQNESVDPEPHVRRRIQFELDRARTVSPDLSPCVLLVFSRSFALTTDSRMKVAREWILWQLCDTWDQPRLHDTFVQARATPWYPFSDSDASTTTSTWTHLAREIAEATGELPSEKLLARDVHAEASGEVIARDDEARLTIRAPDGTEHVVEGLIATRVIVGDRIFPGDLLGIAPL